MVSGLRIFAFYIYIHIIVSPGRLGGVSDFQKSDLGRDYCKKVLVQVSSHCIQIPYVLVIVFHKRIDVILEIQVKIK